MQQESFHRSSQRFVQGNLCPKQGLVWRRICHVFSQGLPVLPRLASKSWLHVVLPPQLPEELWLQVQAFQFTLSTCFPLSYSLDIPSLHFVLGNYFWCWGLMPGPHTCSTTKLHSWLLEKLLLIRQHSELFQNSNGSKDKSLPSQPYRLIAQRQPILWVSPEMSCG